jgi:hypothetical protein
MKDPVPLPPRELGASLWTGPTRRTLLGTPSVGMWNTDAWAAPA